MSFLHSQLEWVAMFATRFEDGDRPEWDGRVAGAVGALRAVGLLGREEADSWEARLAGASGEPAVAGESVRREAAELLGELLDAVPPGKEAVTGMERSRFEGAARALAALGAAGEEWDERLRKRMGSTPAGTLAGLTPRGGSERELVAVLAGPPRAVDGVRVLYALRFADGIAFAVHGERSAEDLQGWPYTLRDDVGTAYAPGGGSGGDLEQRIGFRTAPPRSASWVELIGIAESPIRVAL